MRTNKSLDITCDKNFLVVVGILAIFLFSSQNIYPQPIFQQEPSGQPGDTRPPLVEEKSTDSSSPLKIPPLHLPKKKGKAEIPLESLFVRKIKVTGSTVFSELEVSKITAPYENRELTYEDLESLRKNLTLLYIKSGYITSGAVIPDQKVIGDVITIHVIEGKLSDIKVEDNRYLRDSFYSKRIKLGAGPPVKVDDLQQSLSFLQEDQIIKRLDANLKPGLNLGESCLGLNVEEGLPYRIWVGYDNYISDSVGGEQIQITGAHLSLTGNGDILSLTMGYAEGLKPKIDSSYSIPLTADDLTLNLRYRKNDFDLVNEAFKDLDVKTNTDIYSISLRYPYYRIKNHKFAFSLELEHEKQKTSLLNIPFSLEPGAESGVVKVTPLRFRQEYVYRTQKQVVSAMSMFSYGINALDATSHEINLPDGEFSKWNGQLQWARLTDARDIQVIFRSYFQYSFDTLVSLEKASVGGRYTVRGYPENFFVRDNAAVFSLESRIPVVRHKAWADYLQIVPFIDWGRADNKDFPTPPGPKSIYSIGVGLRWGAIFYPSTLRLSPQFEIFYGYKLRDVPVDVENTFQDNGISFQITFSAF